VESLLAGTIGSASARIMVASVVEEEPLRVDEVLEIIDEASQVLAYSRELEQKSRELERASTELRVANERLKELDRLKDDFVSTVSHELRTPLTSIRAFSEILNDNPQLDAVERKRFLGIIIKESERLTRLINQVLDLSKIESGSAEWRISAIDLKDAIEDAVAATSQLFTEKGVALVTDLPDAVTMVEADYDRVLQVLINLLSNAVKFCDAGTGRVGIRLIAERDALRVAVRDNGPGIAASDQLIIFEKFRQASDTLADRAEGTGLGLPISRQIIAHFGGKLWVESEPGKGATFAFTVPVGRAAAAPSVDPAFATSG
jgi:signal transduction histidine kinase